MDSIAESCVVMVNQLPQEYVTRLENILGVSLGQGGVAKLSFRWQTLPEAREHAARIRKMQDDLRQVREDLNLHIARTRSLWENEKASTGAGFLARLAGPEIAESHKSWRLARLDRRYARALASCEQMVASIDTALVKLSGIGVLVDNWIANQGT
jgi:hypothetical protein